MTFGNFMVPKKTFGKLMVQLLIIFIIKSPFFALKTANLCFQKRQTYGLSHTMCNSKHKFAVSGSISLPFLRQKKGFL